MSKHWWKLSHFSEHRMFILDTSHFDPDLYFGGAGEGILRMDVWTTNRTHLLPLPGQLPVRVGVEDSQGRHGCKLWRESGRRWVLPLEMRLLLSECQNSLEERSQPLNSP